MNELDRLLAFPIRDVPYVFAALLLAFAVHEFAHAWTAWKFGDQTARRQGRVTLNPLKHLDVFGTLLIFIAGFGWAKPVPVDRSFFRRARLMGVVVSAAGPLSNLLLAAAILFLHYALVRVGGYDAMSAGVYEVLIRFFDLSVRLNLLLFVFNLIPLPPLDGYRIVNDVAPPAMRLRMNRFEPWSMLVFLLLVFIPPLYRITIGPILSLAGKLYIWLNGLMIGIFT